MALYNDASVTHIPSCTYILSKGLENNTNNEIVPINAHMLVPEYIKYHCYMIVYIYV